MSRECTHAERVARAALSGVVEPAAVRVARRVLERGPVAAWIDVREGDDDLDRRGVLKRRSAGIDGEALLGRGAAAGLRFVCPGDADWPEPLDALELTLDVAEPVPPPFGLWVRGGGNLRALTRQAVAVVGSRAASRYGQQVSADLGADLALMAWTVVSGAAYGIDVAAHRGALALGGPTMAVLACGADVAYPRPHAHVLDRVAEDGLVVSELPPGATPTRSRFLARNRLIAGLTAGTVVVEAARRSGALNTAGWAGKLSRSVLAVPGPVTSSLSVGCHDLVRSGAILVADATQVIDAVGRLGTDAEPLPSGERRAVDDLSPDARDVVEQLPARDAVDTEELARLTGHAAKSVEAALVELAAAGMVTSAPDGWRVVHGAVSAWRA